MKLLAKLILKIFGWKIDWNNFSKDMQLHRCILIGAPHTSNWDFVFARSALYIMGLNPRIAIKKEMLFFPLNLILKPMGALAIERNKNANTVDSIVKLFQDYDKLSLIICPEGSRKKVKEWKSGFYHIAQKANVPIYLTYLDYKKKIAGFGPLIKLTGVYEVDLEKIKSFYRTIVPKYPALGV